MPEVGRRKTMHRVHVDRVLWGVGPLRLGKWARDLEIEVHVLPLMVWHSP